jgi:6-phosphogluconolactonase/glucosamine-6-phosphate isomerase/deaminase
VKYKFSTNPVLDSATLLANSITHNLASNKKVLWLASGGSGLDVGVKMLELLADVDLSNLTITLTDERYGPFGHQDENWQQFIEKGAQFGDAKTYRVLLDSQSAEQVIQSFNKWLEEALETHDYVIGLFGIGTDGHTAGIKPSSPATTSTELATHFQGDDFHRITITPQVFNSLDEVVVQASGAEKYDILHNLLNTELPVTERPAELLKTVPKSILITDNKMEGL